MNLIKVKYNEIISIKNLYEAWGEFVAGKKNKADVAEFALNLHRNISTLHAELENKTYIHGKYKAFNINDPKPRNIHKATVRDRLLHHAIYRILYPYFDKKFIHDSYSCRLNKGTHKAMERFKQFGNQVSKNNTRICWVLKCDIRKFFASVDHAVLLEILNKYIEDKEIIWLLERVITSFHAGLPLGNLTSQLLVNIYMNEFDQFVKHGLKIKYYIRFADDFVILSSDRQDLLANLRFIEFYLKEELKLALHPDKVFIKTFASGVDFLGWVSFAKHRVLRTATKKRMFKNLSEKSLASYMGMLKWGSTNKLRSRIVSMMQTSIYMIR